MKLSHNQNYSKKLLAEKREKKRLNRLRKNSKYRGDDFLGFDREQHNKVRIDNNILTSFHSNFYEFFLKNKFITGFEKSETEILIPVIFNLKTHYDIVIETIGNIVSSIKNNLGKEIKLDFSKCKNSDQSALFILQIIRLEMQEELIKFDRRLNVLTTKIKFVIIKSDDLSVNLNLLLNGFLPETKIKKDIVPIDTIGFLKGVKSKKDYLENKKGRIGTQIVDHFNKCLMSNNFSLTPTGKNDLGNMIGEILNNSEDHSPTNTYYVTANYYIDKSIDDNGKSENVGVLNLSFLNFGYSIYDGLMENRELNKETFGILNDTAENLKGHSYTKENLFTLYALQDGVSRLKYEDNSRGTGTMTFINCFFSIGDYENVQRNLFPQLTILSGSTQLQCNNRFRPVKQENGLFLLSLNKENDLNVPPDDRHLKNLKYRFPGTILSVKFCLNEEHIQRKINGNGN